MDTLLQLSLKKVRGSLKNVSSKRLTCHSVFFTKKLQTAENGVIVTGTLHYWFTEAGEKISLEKSYLISYAVGNHGLVFLKNIEEVSIEKE